MRISEHRAAARIAWRHARRAPRRTALVLTLVALPIFALTGAGFALKTAIASPEDRATGELGSADATLQEFYPQTTPEAVHRALPAGTILTYGHARDVERVEQGTYFYLRFLEYTLPPERAPIAARYAVLHGRMPRAANEAAIHPKMAELYGVTIGGEFVVRGSTLTGRPPDAPPEEDLSLRVVGIVVEREGLQNITGLVGPGTIRRNDPQGLYWLIDLPAGTSVDEARRSLIRAGLIDHEEAMPSRADIMAARRREDRMMTAVSFAGALGGLFGTGLIVSAALGVGARRQLRTLGLVGATGGEARHVRATVLWGGALQGIVGSAAGIALAIGAAYAARPHMGRFANRVVGPVRLPWLIIAGGLVLGTIAATVAAWAPARRAARMTTVDALAGRTPRPKPASRIFARGLIAVVAGGVLIAIGTATRQEKIIGGALVLTLGGFLFAIPLLVTIVGRLPVGLPTSLRVAARQTARYGRRTSAAVAAATLALVAPVAVAATTLSEEAYNNTLIGIGKDQVMVRWSPYGPNVVSLAPSEGPGLSPEAVAAARRELPGSVAGMPRAAIWPTTGPVKNADRAVATLTVTVPGGSGFEAVTLHIADAGVLEAMRLDRAKLALERGAVVLVGREAPRGGTVGIRSGEFPEKQGAITVPSVGVGSSLGSSLYIEELPQALISEAAARRAGLGVGPVEMAILRAPHDLSEDEITAVKDAVSRFESVTATVRSDRMVDSEPARLLITAGAALIALIIVAVAVSLVGAESRREYAIIVALGAGPGTRRRSAAANAFFVSALAGLLAVPAGLVPVAIVQLSRSMPHPFVVPWSIMGIVALGAPLIAAAIASVTSREPTSHALLQPSW